MFTDEDYYLYKPENERDYGAETLEILIQDTENKRNTLDIRLACKKAKMNRMYQIVTSDVRSRFAKDVEAIDGTYVLLGAGYSIPVAEITCIDIAGSVGFGSENMNMGLYGSNKSGAGLSDLLIGVSAPFSVMEVISLTPSILFSSILDSDGSDAYDDAGMDASNVFFSLTASKAF